MLKACVRPVRRTTLAVASVEHLRPGDVAIVGSRRAWKVDFVARAVPCRAVMMQIVDGVLVGVLLKWRAYAVR